MKKQNLMARISTIILILAFLFVFPNYAMASNSSNEIKNIDINIELTKDGSANITEIWDVNANDGTEMYLNKDNLGDMKVENLAVENENGLQYENINNWNMKATIDEKAGKCGYVFDNNRTELCWGIGSYGNHTFKISYTMTNFVKSMNDFDAFNYRAVNDKLSANPQYVKVTIASPENSFTVDNTGIWAFGYVGEINIIDGKIVAESMEPFDSSNYVGIMARFEKGLFSPTSVKSESFSVMKEKALKGSDYGNSDSDGIGGTAASNITANSNEDGGSDWFAIIFTAIAALVIAAFVILILMIFSRKKRYKKNYYKKNFGYNKNNIKEISYNREIPMVFQENLSAAYWSFKELENKVSDGSILGAYILKWLNKKYIGIIQEESRSMFSNKLKPAIVFNITDMDNIDSIMEKSEAELYFILKRAAKNGATLQEKDLEKWVKSNTNEIDSWLKDLNENGSSFMVENSSAIETEIGKSFSSDLSLLNEKGFTETTQLMGFKKYLKDFTIINEREPVEVELWSDYLIFANLFGIADQVAKDFKNIYPEYFVLNDGSNFDYFNTIIFINMFSRTFNSSMKDARISRDGGGGGFSSLGGGGGFSGGGSGGGFR